jgi:phage tail sheath gpL-like
MISFSFIPGDIRVPGSYVEFDSSKALSGLPAVPQRILLIGQRLATGSIAALTPVRINSADEAVQAFGRGSLAAHAFAALKAANDRTEAWGIGLSDIGGGTNASGTITVTGPATASGTILLYIAGRRLAVGVTAGDTANTIAAAIAARVQADADGLVTAAAAAAVVTLTARNKGTAGNAIDVRHSYYQGESLPAGVTLAIVAMSGGATDPDVSTVWAAIGDAKYETIILPFADPATMASAEAELASRAGPLRAIEGIGYAALAGTQGTLAAAGAARNSQYVSIIGAKASPSHPVAWAAAYAGTIAFHAAIDPARPFQTLTLNGILPPRETDRFTLTERELLLRDGISTFRVDPSGVAAIERAITTYQVNAQALDDRAWLDLTTSLTLFYIRFAVRSRIATKYPRHKLADDGTAFGQGQAIVTPGIIRAELIALFRDLESAGLVEGFDQYVQDLIVERDATDRNRINALIPPDIVNGFLVFAAKIEFRL